MNGLLSEIEYLMLKMNIMPIHFSVKVKCSKIVIDSTRPNTRATHKM